MLSEQKFKFSQPYIKPISWNVSSFGTTAHMFIINKFIELWDTMKVNEHFPINYVNGSFITKWQGGREAMSFATKDEIKNHIKFYNDHNIGVKMTLSNTTISSKDFNDPYLNFLLTTLNNGKNNGAIVVVDDFAKYIRDTYPNIKITASLVKTEVETSLGKTDTPDYYNSKFGLYDEVVVNTARAFDDDFLDQIQDLSKIEFIVNHSCTLNCQMAGLHHKLIEQMVAIKEECILKNQAPENNKEFQDVTARIKKCLDHCQAIKRENDLNKIKYEFINVEEINHLLERGVYNFKLEGRDLSTLEVWAGLFHYIFNLESCFNKLYPM